MEALLHSDLNSILSQNQVNTKISVVKEMTPPPSKFHDKTCFHQVFEAIFCALYLACMCVPDVIPQAVLLLKISINLQDQSFG